MALKRRLDTVVTRQWAQQQAWVDSLSDVELEAWADHLGGVGCLAWAVGFLDTLTPAELARMALPPDPWCPVQQRWRQAYRRWVERPS